MIGPFSINNFNDWMKEKKMGFDTVGWARNEKVERGR